MHSNCLNCQCQARQDARGIPVSVGGKRILHSRATDNVSMSSSKRHSVLSIRTGYCKAYIAYPEF